MNRANALCLLWLGVVVALPLRAGVWQDDFSGNALAAGWGGDIGAFRLEANRLVGVSAHPILPRLAGIWVGKDWQDYTASVRVNVAKPNLAICSKGGLALARRDGSAIVFAVHTPSQQVEVFEWFTRKPLVALPMALAYDEWHTLRADVEARSIRFIVDGVEMGTLRDLDASGGIGVVVEDTMLTLFDDFRVAGETIPNGGHGEVARVSSTGRATAVWASLKR